MAEARSTAVPIPYWLLITYMTTGSFHRPIMFIDS